MHPNARLFPALVAAALAASLMPAQEVPTVGADNANPDTKSSKSHTAMISSKSFKVFYTKKYDLSGLPHYQPEQQATGDLHVMGNNYIGDSNVARWWQEAFNKFQPGVRIVYNLPSAAISFPALEFGGADLVMDHKALFYDLLGYERLFGADPYEITALTGSYNVTGWISTYGIIVNKANPFSKISMKQLDGVFGAQRPGGWDGTSWRPDWARGPEQNLRTWGQLGMTGEWAEKPIHTYGFSVRYSAAIGFANIVLAGSDKWADSYMGYGNYRDKNGKVVLEGQQIVDAVGKDPYAIGFALWQDSYASESRMIAVSAGDSTDYIQPGWDTLFDCSYPLANHFYWYLNHKPGAKWDPKVREFLRFVLSQEGQEILMRDGKYLPLNADLAREQWKKLDK